MFFWSDYNVSLCYLIYLLTTANKTEWQKDTFNIGNITEIQTVKYNYEISTCASWPADSTSVNLCLMFCSFCWWLHNTQYTSLIYISFTASSAKQEKLKYQYLFKIKSLTHAKINSLTQWPAVSTGLHYAMFSIIMQFAVFVSYSCPGVLVCPLTLAVGDDYRCPLHVKHPFWRMPAIDVPSSQVVETAKTALNWILHNIQYMETAQRS